MRVSSEPRASSSEADHPEAKPVRRFARVVILPEITQPLPASYGGSERPLLLRARSPPDETAEAIFRIDSRDVTFVPIPGWIGNPGGL
jgi:hypothetical protein